MTEIYSLYHSTCKPTLFARFPGLLH